MRNSLRAALCGMALLAGAPALAATDAVSQCQSETLVMGTYVYQNGTFTAIENGTADGAAALNACLQDKARARSAQRLFLWPEREPRCSITLVGGTGYICRPTRY